MMSSVVKNIRFVQGNLHSSYPAMTMMNHYLTKNRADIALIQEFNAKNRKIFGLSRLRGTLFSDLKSSRPRKEIAILMLLLFRSSVTRI